MARPRNTGRMGPRTVGRLSLYRRVLAGLQARNVPSVFSRDLAEMAGVSPSLVRQDLMGIHYRGNPQLGYEVPCLDEAIGRKLAGQEGQNVVLLGVGHLGRSIIQYFQHHHPQLSLVAALEIDTDEIGKCLNGVPVVHLAELEGIAHRQDVRVAILAVPDREAQLMADRLVAAGVRSILNFTGVRLQVPEKVYVENTDIGLALERVAFYAGRREPVRS